MTKRGSKQNPDLSPIERRIRAQYKALRKRPEFGMSAVWMHLARQWKMPVKDIKRIVGREPRLTMRNIITIRITK